jgi:squalene-hopene/tetraprenyl-beta-curcumene cyclase
MAFALVQCWVHLGGAAMKNIRSWWIAFSLAFWIASTSWAADDLLKQFGLEPVSKNSPDEPLSPEFSPGRAVRFLDSVAIEWQQTRGCFTCHTNCAYLYARPGLSGDQQPLATVRAFAEELVLKRWPDKGPRWDAEVVAAAAALAFHDSATTGKLHPVTRAALDRMWTIQRADGGWNWLKCDWPPMESDDHYGATLAAIAVGAAPENYIQSASAKEGVAKIKQYLAANPAPTAHHQAMVLWAASYLPDLVTDESKRDSLAELKKLQRPDGGWAAASLGNWKRGDGKEQDTQTSDGYGTGFVLFVLKRSGEPVGDPSLQRGVAWLKSHQRASGRWFTRSLFKDNHHFLTHAGTAFAVMALRECGEMGSNKVAVK